MKNTYKEFEKMLLKGKIFEGFESTIAHRQILMWMDDNFYPGCVELKFTGKDTAVITDMTHESMNVRYTKELGVVEF